MTDKTLRNSEDNKIKQNEQQTNSVLNDAITLVDNKSEEPVVYLGIKRVLSDAFGFIKVGGDFS